MTEREMKIQKLSRAVRPAQAAPVRRDEVALNHRDGSPVNGVEAASWYGGGRIPFAGDDAE